MLKTHEIFDFQTKNCMVRFSVPQKCKILAAWSLKGKKLEKKSPENFPLDVLDTTLTIALN
jgi:hypothetical protein